MSILPDYSVKRGELVQVNIEGVDLIQPVKLIWEKGQILDPVQQAFLQLDKN